MTLFHMVQLFVIQTYLHLRKPRVSDPLQCSSGDNLFLDLLGRYGPSERYDLGRTIHIIV